MKKQNLLPLFSAAAIAVTFVACDTKTTTSDETPAVKVEETTVEEDAVAPAVVVEETIVGEEVDVPAAAVEEEVVVEEPTVSPVTPATKTLSAPDDAPAADATPAATDSATE